MPSQERRDHKTNETPKPPEGFIKPEDKPPNAESAEHTGGDNSQKAESRLDRDMVFWTRAVGIFTALLVVSSVLQYCAMRGQQNVMEGQLTEALADNRPWVPIPKITSHGPLVFGPNGSIAMPVNFEIQNFGRAPALNVEIRFEIEVVKFTTMINNVPDQNRLCAVTQDAVKQKAHDSQSIFPGDTIEIGGVASGVILSGWPAAGFEDTEISVFIEPEAYDGASEVYG